LVVVVPAPDALVSAVQKIIGFIVEPPLKPNLGLEPGGTLSFAGARGSSRTLDSDNRE